MCSPNRMVLEQLKNRQGQASRAREGGRGSEPGRRGARRVRLAPADWRTRARRAERATATPISSVPASAGGGGRAGSGLRSVPPLCVGRRGEWGEQQTQSRARMGRLAGGGPGPRSGAAVWGPQGQFRHA
jgi:hypothetical protein